MADSSASSAKARVRPLLVRPGARYTCFGDGLCCTDIHVLGPLGRSERKRVEAVDPEAVVLEEGLDGAPVLRIAPDGGCHFLLPDRRCSIHAEHGPQQKPGFCRRFPVGLVATPQGGRVTTEHRCPCRTLGERPLLDPESALPSIADRRGRPKADRRVKKVWLAKKKKVPFDEWRVMEAELLGRMAEGEDPAAVLGAAPFPRLKKSSWEAEMESMVEEAIDGSAFGFAAAWFAEAVFALRDPEHRVRLPMRPWSPAFDRAEARPGAPRHAEEVFADWIADEIWALAWTDDRSFDVACADWATRLQVAREVAGWLEEEGHRADRAAAEGVMVAELIGDSEFWTDIVSLMRP